MNREHLKLSLRAAIAARRPAALQQLLDDRGLVAFATALAAWSPRVVADALTLLPTAQRGAVLRHVPSALREDLHHLGVELVPGSSNVRPAPVLERMEALGSVARQRTAPPPVQDTGVPA